MIMSVTIHMDRVCTMLTRFAFWCELLTKVQALLCHYLLIGGTSKADQCIEVASHCDKPE